MLLAGFGIDQVAQHMPLARRGPAGPVDPAMIPGMPDFLRKADQFGEIAHAGRPRRTMTLRRCGVAATAPKQL